MLSKGFVRAKLHNYRTLMRRNWRGAAAPDRVLAEIKRDAEQSARANNLDALLRFEGSAASRYFGAFGDLIKQDPDPESLRFDFTKRNRRPPLDPVNALLSYAYARDDEKRLVYGYASTEVFNSQRERVTKVAVESALSGYL